MPADSTMSQMAKLNQWDLAEQFDICIEYIDRQKDDPTFLAFLLDWAAETKESP